MLGIHFNDVQLAVMTFMINHYHDIKVMKFPF